MLLGLAHVEVGKHAGLLLGGWLWLGRGLLLAHESEGSRRLLLLWWLVDIQIGEQIGRWLGGLWLRLGLIKATEEIGLLLRLGCLLHETKTAGGLLRRLDWLRWS